MKTFSELNLFAPLQRAIEEENYVTPTPIQAATIPAALEKRDILGIAQTGTGKTAAFLLPLLHRLGKRSRKAAPNFPSALVLAPTRELAGQIAGNVKAYGRHLKVKHTLIYGGVSQFHQVKAMQKGAHLVIATPGRLLDLIDQGFIDLNRVETFVLDEADRMMDMGFYPDIEQILEMLPEDKQSMFFSATMNDKIGRLARKLLSDPHQVDVTPTQNVSLDSIDQQVVHLDSAAKRPVLLKLLQAEHVGPTVVFARTKRGANHLSEFLEKRGIKAAAIHGNKTQNARQKALDGFRSRRIEVLVATDVAARGLDIDGVTHVVNYDLPDEPESYVHRIGRTGRAGANGIAISFCTGSDRRELRNIERLVRHKIRVNHEFDHTDHSQMSGEQVKLPEISHSETSRDQTSNQSSKRPPHEAKSNRRRKPRQTEAHDTGRKETKRPKSQKGKQQKLSQNGRPRRNRSQPAKSV